MTNRLFAGAGSGILSNLSLNSTLTDITTFLGAGYTHSITTGSAVPTISSDGVKVSFSVTRTSDSYRAQYVGTLSIPFNLSTLSGVVALNAFSNSNAAYMFNGDGTKSFLCSSNLARISTHPTPYSLTGISQVTFTVSIASASNGATWNRSGLEYYFYDAGGMAWRKITTTVPYTFTSSVESVLTANTYACIGTLTNSLTPLYYSSGSLIYGNGTISAGTNSLFSFSQDDTYLMVLDKANGFIQLYS